MSWSVEPAHKSVDDVGCDGRETADCPCSLPWVSCVGMSCTETRPVSIATLKLGIYCGAAPAGRDNTGSRCKWRCRTVRAGLKGGATVGR